MPPLKIYLVPHPVLRAKAAALSAIDDALRALAENMLDTMYANDGIGLAAPQVGIGQRLLVLDVEQSRKDDIPPEKRRVKPMAFINPEIVWHSDEKRSYTEGCLSIPAQYADIERPDRVRVRYTDITGAVQEIEAGGLLSTCLQHEIDHLNGVLFIDYLSGLKRDMILRKLKKFTRDNADDLDRTHIL